jgi:hypothetical protein
MIYPGLFAAISKSVKRFSPSDFRLKSTFMALIWMTKFLFRKMSTWWEYFKVCKSVHHRTIQINYQPDATIFQFIILTFIYSSTYIGRFPAHHQELSDCNGSHWFYLCIVVTVVLRSWSGRLARPRTQHDYHHDAKVKPVAAIFSLSSWWWAGKRPI